MLSLDWYCEQIRSCLAQHQEALVTQLRSSFTYPFPSSVDHLVFEVHYNYRSEENTVSVMLFRHDDEMNECFDPWGHCPDEIGALEVLPEVVYFVLPGDRTEGGFDELYDSGAQRAETTTFSAWFHECWLLAGGANLTIPSYL